MTIRMNKTHHRTCIAAILAAAAVALSFAAEPARAQSAADPFRAGLIINLEVSVKKAPTKFSKDVAEAIRAFYASRQNASLWYGNNGLNEQAAAFFAALEKLEEHGLNPKDYGMPGLAERAAKASGDKARAAMELELTATLVRYIGDLAAGSVKPNRTAPGLFIQPNRPTPDRVLSELGSVEDFRAYLKSAEPKARRYLRLKAALARYRALADKGGWQKIAEGPTLKPGMTDPRIKQVRARLLVTGELKSMGAKPELFDEALVEAVKKFQSRHGISEDGKIGKNTVKEMNVSIDDRIQQIMINMERRRWMPADLGRKYVMANIADFDLKVVENDQTIHVTRIVVGKTYHKTPIFSNTIKYIEFNPHWNVPYSIATKEMLPKIKKDPGYLTRNRYMLLRKPVDNSSAIDPHAVDWETITRRGFPYYIRQKPGKGNALGTMIFMFPNKFNVFMHDTQSRSLFGRTVRSFSHGCVRVENPWDLAILLLKEKGGWDRKRIDKVIKSEEPQRVYLKTPVPVHIVYVTAWANSDGSVQFRPDIYKRDHTLQKVLNRPTRIMRK